MPNDSFSLFSALDTPCRRRPPADLHSVVNERNVNNELLEPLGEHILIGAVHHQIDAPGQLFEFFGQSFGLFTIRTRLNDLPEYLSIPVLVRTDQTEQGFAALVLVVAAHVLVQYLQKKENFTFAQSASESHLPFRRQRR